MERKRERSFSINDELLGEYGDLYSDDFLDEEALVLAMEDE